MNLKASNCVSRGIDNHVEEGKSEEIKLGPEEDDDCSAAVNKVDDSSDQIEEANILENIQNQKLSDWEARRYGAMAARILRDVKTL